MARQAKKHPVWAEAFGFNPNEVRSAVVNALNQLPRCSPADKSLVARALEFMPDSVASMGWADLGYADCGILVTATPQPPAVQARYVSIREGAVYGMRFARIHGPSCGAGGTVPAQGYWYNCELACRGKVEDEE